MAQRVVRPARRGERAAAQQEELAVPPALVYGPEPSTFTFTFTYIYMNDIIIVYMLPWYGPEPSTRAAAAAAAAAAAGLSGAGGDVAFNCQSARCSGGALSSACSSQLNTAR